MILYGGLLMAALEASLLPLSGPFGHILILFPLVFLVYLGAGAWAWYRRPSNRMGTLILWGGFAVFVGGLPNTDIPILAAAGQIGATLVLAVIVHLLHAFPSGRLRGRVSQLSVATAYVTSLLLQAPGYLFSPGGSAPDLFIGENPSLVAAGGAVQQLAGATVMLTTAVVLVGRLIRADNQRRRVLVPLFAYGAAVMLFIPFSGQILDLLGHPSAEVQTWLQLLAIGGIPVAFTWGMLVGGFAKTGELQELGSWLGATGAERPALTHALARVLGDPSVQISFWVPRREVFVTEDGSVAENQGGDSNRARVHVELDGRVIGAISYDSSLISTQEPVREAGKVVALAMDRERLTAELRRSHTDLQRSRERLVDAADQERRRLAQDLHDGLQMHLVLLALDAQKLANTLGGSEPDAGAPQRATTLRKGIDSAAADLRSLVHAVMPAALIERGLAAAAEDLVDRMPVPTTLELGIGSRACSPAVESTAYFVLAEAMTNVLKHAHATSVRISLHLVEDWLRMEIHDDGGGGARLSGATGLRGVMDRVDVLGGQTSLVSQLGEGTHIVVELPCM